MAFYNACVRSTNSSIITYPKNPTTSIKKLVRRQLLKKSSNLIHHHSKSNARFQRIKGSNFVREINPIAEYNFKTNTTNNYDMTVIHDDQFDNTHTTLSYRQFKKIPHWSRKSQLQLAFINQVYFNDKNPEDIFGSIRIDLAHEMIESMELNDTDLYSSSIFPPNFV